MQVPTKLLGSQSHLWSVLLSMSLITYRTIHLPLFSMLIHLYSEMWHVDDIWTCWITQAGKTGQWTSACLGCSLPDGSSVADTGVCSTPVNWSLAADAPASSRVCTSRGKESSSRQVIGCCLHCRWHTPPPLLDTSVVFIRAKELCAALCY